MTAIDATPAPANMPGRDVLAQNGIALLTLFVVALPLAPILYQSLIDRPLYDAGGTWTAANYLDLLTSQDFLKVIGNTLALGFLTTFFSAVFGVVGAIVIGRTDVPFRAAVGELFLWPLYISHLVLGFGYSVMYGPSGFATLFAAQIVGDAPWDLYTIPGMALICGVAQAPITYLFCIASTQAADPALEDAARISGARPVRVMWSISLPLLQPAIVYSVILNFTVALELLAIPLLFGRPAGYEFLTTYLYKNGIDASTPNYGLVGAAAVLLLALVSFLLWLQGRLLRNSGRFVTVGGKASRPRQLALGPWRWPVFVAMAAYIGLAVIVPIVGVALRSVTSFLTPLLPVWEVLTADHWELIFSYPAYIRAMLNSIGIAVFGGALCTIVVALIALVVHRSEFRHARALEFVATYPRAVPGLIAGIGFLWAMVLFPPLGLLHNTIWILVVAYVMRYLPTGFGAMSPMLLQIGRELDRSARTVGADWWTTVTRIILPLVKPALFSTFAILFIAFFREYATAVFLISPGAEVIGVMLLSFWIQGDAGPVAALAMFQIAITFAFVYGARHFLGVKIYG